MTEQTDAAEADLGYLLARNMNNLYGTRDRVQAAILASDWLAAREAAARAEALREAADAWEGGPTGAAPVPAWWLRDRADSIARTDGAGS